MQDWLWDIRRKVNLLQANGHADAAFYPLGFLGDEVNLEIERQNQAMASQAVVMRSAIGAVVDAAFGGKEAGKQFTELVKKLSGE